MANGNVEIIRRIVIAHFVMLKYHEIVAVDRLRLFDCTLLYCMAW